MEIRRERRSNQSGNIFKQLFCRDFLSFSGFSFGAFLLFSFFIFIPGISLFAIDFENPKYGISLTTSNDWSRKEKMEKKIDSDSCLLSLLNKKTSESFNLIVIPNKRDDDFENLSESEKQRAMEKVLIESAKEFESQLGVTINRNYLKRIGLRDYAVFEYKLDGFFVIQAVGIFKRNQYIFMMAAVVDKPNEKFFDILETVSFTH